MTIRPFTDHEWDNLPHVVLTADVDWDPSILDFEQESIEKWYNAMEDLPALTPDPLFDEYGDYRNTVAISQVLMTDPLIERINISDLPHMFQIYAQEVKPREIDYEQYISKFAYMPVDIIKRTFQ